MPGKRVRELTDIEIDEVSLVDIPANQYATVAIAKRATEEDQVPKIYNEEGVLLDESKLKHGDVVYDEDQNPLMFVIEGQDLPEGVEFEDELDDEVEEEPELAPVGKSLGQQVRDDLAKALTEIERDDVISKAMEQVSKAEQRAQAAEQIAKAERTLRLEREYVAKAAEYSLPIDPQELGPVLMRMAETMSYDDCAVIAKALDATSGIFEELGVQGMGSNADPFAEIEALAEGAVSKAASDGKTSKEELIAKHFEENPAAYDQWLADRGL
jgi:hypothetical protein